MGVEATAPVEHLPCGLQGPPAHPAFLSLPLHPWADRLILSAGRATACLGVPGLVFDVPFGSGNPDKWEFLVLRAGVTACFPLSEL